MLAGSAFVDHEYFDWSNFILHIRRFNSVFEAGATQVHSILPYGPQNLNQSVS